MNSAAKNPESNPEHMMVTFFKDEDDLVGERRRVSITEAENLSSVRYWTTSCPVVLGLWMDADRAKADLLKAIAAIEAKKKTKVEFFVYED